MNEYEISINNPKNINSGQYIELNIDDITTVEKEPNTENNQNTILSKYLYYIKTNYNIKKD